jgi:hypothetical protein
MELADHAAEAHRALSYYSIKFLDFVEKNPGSLIRSNYSRLLEKNDESTLNQPWPTFISRSLRNRMETCSLSVFKLIKSIPQRFFGNDAMKISRYFEIPPDTIKRQLDGINDAYLDNLLGRGDFIFSPAGLKCLEYNIGGNVGGWEIGMLESLSMSVPPVAKFLQDADVKIYNENVITILMAHLTDAALKQFPDPGPELNIAAATPYLTGDSGMIAAYFNQLYGETLAARGSHLKGNIVFCHYEHLNVAGQYLYYNGKRIHSLIERYKGFVPPAIMEVFKAGNVLLYNGPIQTLLSDKFNIALLSEHEDSDLFTADEKETIKKYIPWTRKIAPGKITVGSDTFDTENYIISNRSDLVLKPSQGMAGEGILIGRNTPAQEWEKAIKRALVSKTWLVQEYIESYSYMYQWGEKDYKEHHAVWGFLVFGSLYAGILLRLLPVENRSGVINTHQGAEQSVVFEVDR